MLRTCVCLTLALIGLLGVLAHGVGNPATINSDQAGSAILLPSTPENTAGAAATFTITGVDLTPVDGNLTVTAPGGVDVSSDGATWSPSFAVAYTGSALGATTIYVRLAANATAGNYSGNVVVAGGGASLDQAVQGSVTYVPEFGSATCDLASASVDIASAVQVTVHDIHDQYGAPFVPSTIRIAYQDGAETNVDMTAFTGTVVDTHTYTQPGQYTIVVWIDGDGTTTATVTITYAPEYGSASISILENTYLENVPLTLHISDMLDQFGNTYNPTSIEYSFDGIGFAALTLTSSPFYDVAHTYATYGNKTITVRIDAGNILSLNISVSYIPIVTTYSIKVTPQQQVINAPITLTIYEIRDQKNLPCDPTSMNIDWAAGSQGLTVIPGQITYEVQHSYSAPGNYTLDVELDGIQKQITVVITYTPEFAIATCEILSLSVDVNTAVEVTVRDIRDQLNNPFIPSSIEIDYGDGTTTYPPFPTGRVDAQYLYATPGAYTIIVRIDGNEVARWDVTITYIPHYDTAEFTITPQPDFAEGSPITFTIQNAKDQFGFDYDPSSTRIDINKGAAPFLTDSPVWDNVLHKATYEHAFIQWGNYSAKFFVDSSLCVTLNFTIIAKPPDVTIDQATGQVDPTGMSPINFTVVFSEPVTGFTTGDVSLSGTAGATVGAVAETAPMDGTTYTVAVTGMTSDGTVIARIEAGVAVDLGGNGNTISASTDNTMAYDGTPPAVTINQAAGQADPTTRLPIRFTAIFSEPVNDFTAADITLTGTAGPTTCTVTETSPMDGTTYTVTVTEISNAGTIVASIDANGATDAVGHGNEASTSTDNEVTYAILPSSGSGSGNTAPVPNAGPNQTVVVGQLTALDGTASFDADTASTSTACSSAKAPSGLRYRWTVAVLFYAAGQPVFAMPAGADVFATAEGFDSPIATFIPNVEGTYAFDLFVTDKGSITLSDRVEIICLPNPNTDSAQEPDPIEVMFTAWPNPFVDEIQFGFIGVSMPRMMAIIVFDLTGHLVWESQPSDESLVRWDGRTTEGERLAAGPYIARMLVIDEHGVNHSVRAIVFIQR